MTENKDKNKAEILLLSIAANIVSRHTSMVGVDKDRKHKIVGEMIQREVPLMMSGATSWNMSHGLHGNGTSPTMANYSVSNCFPALKRVV